jgi:hypothetical protein
LEQAYGSTLAHYDHRAPQMGQWVMIIAGWYKSMRLNELEIKDDHIQER